MVVTLTELAPYLKKESVVELINTKSSVVVGPINLTRDIAETVF